MASVLLPMLIVTVLGPTSVPVWIDVFDVFHSCPDLAVRAGVWSPSVSYSSLWCDGDQPERLGSFIVSIGCRRE